jgi:hypothetical protein
MERITRGGVDPNRDIADKAGETCSALMPDSVTGRWPASSLTADRGRHTREK